MCAKRRRWGHIDPIVPDEYYRIRWPDGYDDDGNRKPGSMYVYGTYDDADVELAKVRAALHATRPLDDESLVDRETTWRLFWWLVTVPSFDGLEEKTKSDYRRTWEVELEPRIGRDAVSATNYRQVCRVIADINAPSVQRSAHRLWKKMCNQAVHERVLDYNPVDRTVPMKRLKARVKHTIEAEDVMPYLAAFHGTRYQPYACALMVGGMRPEEALPLMGPDVERAGGFAVAHVRTALTTVDNRRDYKGTKNTPSERDVYFAEPFASLMLQAADCEGPIFPGPRPEGEEPNETWFAHPNTMRNNYRLMCGRRGVAYIRPQDMRTVFSDLCAEAEVLDSLVDLFMGHAGGDGTTRGRNYMTRRRKNMQMVASMLADYLVASAPCAALGGHRDASCPTVSNSGNMLSGFPSSASVAQR